MTFREITEKTKISLTGALLASLLSGVVGLTAAAYAARDQAVEQIRREIRTAVDQTRADRTEALRGYMTREEFWQQVAPKLERLSGKIDRVIEEQRRR